MAQTLHLEVVTPQKVLLTTEADYVTIPGIVGELGVLPGHIPILTELRTGALSYKLGSDIQKVEIKSGYAEVFQDRITILASADN